MENEHLAPDQVNAIVNFCLEELNSSGEIYDRHHSILSSANTSQDEKIVAFGKMSEASKQYLAARDRLAKLGYQPIYDHEHKCYIAKHE